MRLLRKYAVAVYLIVFLAVESLLPPAFQPTARILSAAICCYRAVVSSSLRERNIYICIYEPTCSAYMLEAINRYGTVKGSFLGCKRLLRCNRMHEGGYDPVP